MLHFVCYDGKAEVPVSCLSKMTLFETHPEIIQTGSYKPRCNPHIGTVNLLLSKVYNDSEQVTITQDNFAELKTLAKELGFSGLDSEFHSFKASKGPAPATASQPTSKDPSKFDSLEKRVMALEKLLNEKEKSEAELRDRVARYEKVIDDLQRQLREIQTPQGQVSLQRVESLEKKVDEVARDCELKCAESVRKAKFIVKGCAKQSDLETLARCLKLLSTGKEKRKNRPPPVTETEELSPQSSPEPTPQVETETPNRSPEREFVYNGHNQLNGIIAHLNREYGGNVHNSGVVDVTASPDGDGRSSAWAVVNFQATDCYWSRNEPNAWICYDFKDMRITPTHYTLKSGEGYSGSQHLKSWVIEVSIDGSEWFEVDRRENAYDLNDSFAMKNFRITRLTAERYRYFKLREIGTDHGPYNTSVLILCAMEVFGTLYVPED